MQYRSFRRRGPWAVMYISHSVMEGQRHNNPLNPRCFCLQRPKRAMEVTKALGGSFKLVTLAPRTVRRWLNSPRKHKRMGTQSLSQPNNLRSLRPKWEPFRERQSVNLYGPDALPNDRLSVTMMSIGVVHFLPLTRLGNAHTWSGIFLVQIWSDNHTETINGWNIRWNIRHCRCGWQKD